MKHNATNDHPPIKQHFRRVPFVHHEKISQMIDDMLSMGEPYCVGSQERWSTELLRRLLKTEFYHKERSVSPPMH